MRHVLSGARWTAFVALVFGLGGCQGSDSADTRGGEVVELDPCGGSDHPCTLEGETPEARARTEELTDSVSARLGSPGDLEGIAVWLEEQDDVVSVAIGAEAVRFRVRGGRGRWIFLQTAGTVTTLGGPTGSMPPRLAPGSTVPVLQGTTRGQEKKALLVSAFRWQWEIERMAKPPRGGRGARYGYDGLDEVARALRARDYMDVTVMTEALDPDDPSRTTGGVGLQAFTTWDDYDYVHVLTHGGAVCGRGSARNRCLSALMAPWTKKYVEEQRARAHEEGNEALAETLDLMAASSAQGVETASVQVVAPARVVPELSRGAGDQKRKEGFPLKERERPRDQWRVHTLTGPFVLLTPKFFHETYSEGISDAVVLLSACSSGHTASLAASIKGENSAVIGWKGSMSLGAAAAAGELIARTLVEVDEQREDDSGLTVEQTIDRIRERLDDLASDPPDPATCYEPVGRDAVARCAMSEYASVLTVINDVPADPVTGASLVVYGDSTIRAREIVYLVDEAGEELKRGSLVRVTGAAGDGRADSAELRIRVDGLGREKDPRAVDLQLVFEDRKIDLEDELEEEVAEGVWEVETRVPLGRDHRDGELVDLEVVAVLPDDGESKWLYEDVRLGGCYWTASVTGTAEGPGRVDRRLFGGYVGFGRLPTGQDGPVASGVTLGQAPGSAETEALNFWLLGDLGEADYALGPRRPDGTAMISTPAVPWGQADRAALRIAMFEPDTMVVGGFALAYDGITLPRFGSGQLSIRGEFVWTPTCPTPRDLMLDLGERTKTFLEERGGLDGGSP